MAKETETKPAKLTKAEKAAELKEDLGKQILELKEQILAEEDENKKKKLRKQRDLLNERREAIVITDEKVVIPMSQKAKNSVKAFIAVICIAALIFAYFATGISKHMILSSLAIPQKTLTGVVLTDADGKEHGIKVATYNYYYAVYYYNLKQTQENYAQYGMDSGEDEVDFDKLFKDQKTKDKDDKEITWAEKADQAVLDNIKSVYGYYYAAVKANNGKEPEITEEQSKEIKENLDSYAESAKENKFGLSEYLTAIMGYGVDEETFKRESTIACIADNYKENYQKDLSNKEYTDKEYNEYLEKHRDELVSVDVKFFEATNADDAKAFVEELKDDGSNFAELAVKYSEDDKKDTYKNEVETTYLNATREIFSNLGAAIAAEESEKESDDNEESVHSHPGFDWLFSKKRKAGDKKAYSTSVVYIIKPVNLSDVKTVNVRHILIQPEKKAKEGEEAETVKLSEATKKQKKAALNKAESVLKEYKDGKKTEEAFADLAKKYSKDGNASEGGIYENIVPNQMVSTFNAWCFDSSRKAGDVEIVETEFGYHIIYFVSEGKLPAWKYTAQQAMASESSSSSFTELEDSVKIEKSFPGSLYLENDKDIRN